MLSVRAVDCSQSSILIQLLEESSMTTVVERWCDVSHRSSPFHDVSSPNFIIRDHFLREYEASAKAIRTNT